LRHLRLMNCCFMQHYYCASRSYFYNFDTSIPIVNHFYLMDKESGKSNIKLLDVESVLSAKNPAIKKILPSFILNYLKRIVHQEELNEFITKSRHLRDAEFIYSFLQQFKIKYIVSGTENIPSEGRYIFVSNHPLGGLDGLVFIY
jgi:hypothetical protein